MKESKILLIAFIVIGVICCVMAIVGFWGVNQFGKKIENMANGDPTSVAQIQQKIATFDTPPNYQPMAMSMLVYDVVTLMPTNSNEPMIMLMQYSSLTSTNREEMERSLSQAAQQQNPQQGVTMQVVSTFETTIRGETVTVTVSEGTTQGITFRQWLAIFDGNNGPVLFMAQGNAEDWDEEVLKEFLNSIK